MADPAEHPRPQLRRENFSVLDGAWEFADDPDARWRRPQDVEWNATIEVPFAPETPASGIGTTGFRTACWYRRRHVLRPPAEGGRLLAHFNAVDYRASVWVDGALVGEHEGGYSPFAVDLTAYADGGEHDLIVRAEDDPLDLAKPRGKQDWEPEAHAIWYPRTTGIWQTVWLEELPAISVDRLHWAADLSRWSLHMQAAVQGEPEPGTRMRVRLSHQGRLLVDDSVAVLGGDVERRFVLDSTGIDAMRQRLLWSPEHPNLIDAEVELVRPDGTVADRVESYAGMREVGVAGGRFVLNGRPLLFRLVLDQGYWPETGLTPPDGDALRRDVELAKAMGFNGVRKHQKIEDPRYLYWADRLGLMVWAELPAAYRGGDVAMRRAVRQWTDAIERDRSHPCIVAWVPFNESWGISWLTSRKDVRDYVAGVALLTKALDPSRLVVANDGWEGLGGDIVGIHDYDPVPERLRHRFSAERLADTLQGFGDHGRRHLADGLAQQPDARLHGRAVVISEFGGLGLAASTEVVGDLGTDPDAAESLVDAWSYSEARDGAELVKRYGALVDAIVSSGRLSGFCYTQFADTYQEVNGLLREDRTPKAPLESIARATGGRPLPRLAPPAPPAQQSLANRASGASLDATPVPSG